MKTKALISSTAILLVAVMMLVATGYAWFTAGDSAKINTFDVKIDQKDSALLLAAANFANYAGETKAYKSTLSLTDWQESWCVKGDTLIPVSTATATKDSFYALGYNSAKTQWGGTTTDAEGNEVSLGTQEDSGYILLSFWAKAPVDGSADLSIDFSGDAMGNFNKAVKVAYNVSDSASVGEMNIFDLELDKADTYKPVTGVNATCTKAEGTTARPQFIAGDTDFGAARTYTDSSVAWTNASVQNVSFTANTEKLITVAVWLEGMDADCQGSGWNLKNIAIDISFDNWKVA